MSIAAISPTPFSELTPVAYQSDQDPAGNPSDGSLLAVQAVVQLQKTSGEQVTATYFLTLKARAGRWEVTSVQSAPVSSDPSGPASTSPSPNQ